MTNLPRPDNDATREAIQKLFYEAANFKAFGENYPGITPLVNKVMAIIADETRAAVKHATEPPLDLNAYENQLDSQVSDIDAFNLFIKKWCPHAAHLLDSDDNDGQYMRDRIKELQDSHQPKEGESDE